VILRTGVDLVEIERLARLSPVIFPRFLNRVYTTSEITEANGSLTYLAGRFAVKEAVSKVLGTGIGKVGWQHIETLRGVHGEPMLYLHETAAELAKKEELVNFSVSITHSNSLAIAFVVATGLKSNIPSYI